MIGALRVRLAAWRPTSRRAAWVLIALGLAGLCTDRLAINAFGLEAVATGFWLWARGAESAEVQVRRWSWLRRPAAMLWLALALVAVAGPAADEGATAHAWVRMAAGVAALWAALELLAALPFARPYPDWPGPLSEVGAWLPLLLAGGGVALMVRGSTLWVSHHPIPEVAVALLLFGALVAVVRAFGRPQWPATLRWLAVADSSLAGALVALGRWPTTGVLFLWAAAFSARAVLLWSELRGAGVRRASASRALWRALSWVSGGALAWSTALALGLSSSPLVIPELIIVLAVACALAWIPVARLTPALERRSLQRIGAETMRPAVFGLVVVWWTWAGLVEFWKAGLALAWPWVSVVVGALLATAGLAANLAIHLGPEPARRFAQLSRSARGGARTLYDALVRFEHAAFGAGLRLWRSLLVPLRDLHTGDAQEYLLLLMGLTAVALMLTLLG